jgi:hypothetical protein
LEDYRNKLGVEYKELIQKEKEKDEQRLKNYTEDADDEIKKILEDAFNKERMESSRIIKDFNEYNKILIISF